MRKLIVLLLLVAGLWSGYWFVGARAIENGAEQWFAGAAAQGLVAEKTGLSVQGFPNRFDLTVEGVKLSDPATGIGWQGSFVKLFAMTWKPWHLIAGLPPEEVVTLPDQALRIASQDLMASLRAKLSTDLPLAEARLSGQSMTLASDQGWTLALGEFTVGLRSAPGLGPSDYEFGFDLAPLTPDPGFLAAVRAVAIPDLPASDLPDTVETLSGSILFGLSAPLDRHIGDSQPEPSRIEVKAVDLVWGELALNTTGLIEADAKGYGAGKITVKIRNWNRLPALLVAAGAIKPETAPTLVKGMQVLAAQSPDHDSLTLTLTMADGRMSLGPFPLGPAPLMSPAPG